MTKTVTTLNWAGHGNLGDELILMGLKTLFKDWRVIPMSCDNRGVYPQLDLKVANDCDLFVVGGGELVQKNYVFMPAPRQGLKYRSLLYRLHARSFGRLPWLHRIKIPKVMLGCGVNVALGERLGRNVVADLEEFDYIGLRDNIALAILKSIPPLRSKVGLFHDLTFALDMEISETEHRTGLAVVIPTDRFTRSDRGVLVNVCTRSRDWLKEKLQNYEETVFLAFGETDNDDYETCKNLSPVALNSSVLRASDLSMKQIVNLLSECGAVFSYRLHGLILAFMLGKKYEFYAYHRKLQRVHDTIKGSTRETIRKRQRANFAELLSDLM